MALFAFVAFCVLRVACVCGVMELRIHSQLEHRVFYIAKFVEAIFVIHAFQKKTRKTAKHDIDLAKQRFAELIRKRSKR
jgi:phage-related protein